MASPNISVIIEPEESGRIVYLAMAPKTSGAARKGQLSLKLIVTNNETASVKVTKVRLTFQGSPAVNAASYSPNLTVAAGTTAQWFFQPADSVLLPQPAPPKVKVEVTGQGFTDPWTATYDLAPHVSPVTGGSFLFPARASDFRVGEYWTGRGAGHASAGDGSQLFAYDMGIVGWDTTKKAWAEVFPGKKGDKNDHYRIWGKPLYAMADGVVRSFLNAMNDNTTMGTQTPTPSPVEGNHFWIQHGDEVVVYAHFKKGSLNPAFMSVGATVKAGDFLGVAGNSGNSTNPHLHIHSIEATQPWAGPLRPLPFRNTWVVERTALAPPSPSGPWFRCQGHGCAKTEMALWPAATAPAWYPPGWAELTRFGIPADSYQTEFERIVTSGYRLVWIDGYEVDGKTFFNVILRAADGVPWVARHGLTASQYQAEFNQWVGQGYRLKHIETYVQGGAVRYAAIFIKKSGPAFLAYHGKNATEHQQTFDSLTGQGWVPVNISVVSPNGQRTHAALYEKLDAGTFWTKNFMTASEYQTEFDANVQSGRKLVYLNAYRHGSSTRFTAIWHQKAPAPFLAHHGLTGPQFQAAFDSNLASGFLTRAIAGYEASGTARFAAYWSK
ncbi:MAG TPA: peptidoglycan DD-metalloendopeptidase family protein [Pyrinomonadaceae bacterium]|nr:peptidoglycan DD-metalloendopeptidase family protein [Pyrinomonadaceae bacterium]